MIALSPTRLAASTVIVMLGALSLPSVAAACSGGWQPQHLEDQLMCPTCHVPLNQSDSRAAQDIRNFVRQRCQAGWTEQRTRQALIDQFGTAILAAPPFQGFNAVAWLVPALLLGAGTAGAAGLAWSWSRRKHPPTSPAGQTIPRDLAARIDADLKDLD